MTSHLHGCFHQNLRLETFWGEEYRFELPIFSEKCMNLAVQKNIAPSGFVVYDWAKSFFYKKITIYNEQTHRAEKVLINVSDAVTKLSILGLDPQRIKQAINDDNLFGLIKNVKTDILFNALPDNLITKDELSEALTWVNEHGASYTSYPKKLREDSSLTILNRDGYLFFKIGAYEIGLDDAVLRVKHESLEGLGYNPDQIKKIDAFILNHVIMHKMQPEAAKAPRKVIAPAGSELAAYFPHEVVVISPSKVYLNTEARLGAGSYKTVKKALEVFSGKPLAHYDVDVERVGPEHSPQYIQEIGELVFFKKTKGILKLHEVVKLKDASTDHLIHSVYTKFYNLGSLSHAMSSLSYEEKVTVAKQIAHALKRIHDQNAIHRDLKPANIFLKRTKEGGVKAVIGDLGSLTRLHDVGKRRHNLTTIYYISPECASAMLENNSHALEMANDQSLDVWSLGVILYEIFHGKNPDWVNLNERIACANLQRLEFPIAYPSEHPINKILNLAFAKKNKRASIKTICEELDKL